MPKLKYYQVKTKCLPLTSLAQDGIKILQSDTCHHMTTVILQYSHDECWEIIDNYAQKDNLTCDFHFDWKNINTEPAYQSLGGSAQFPAGTINNTYNPILATK